MLCRWTFGPTLWVSSSGFGRFPALMPVPRAVRPGNLKPVFTLRLYCTFIYSGKAFGFFCYLNYLLAISAIADCLHEHSVRYYLLDSNLFRYRTASECTITFFTTTKRSKLIYFPWSRRIPARNHPECRRALTQKKPCGSLQRLNIYALIMNSEQY